MPSHSAASALIQLYGTKEYPGAPWNWEQWIKITGVKHGLFPAEDENLPEGMTREDCIDIQSYFREYIPLTTDQARLRFSTSSSHRGRQTWTKWVNKYWGSWGIHATVVKALNDHGVHPYSIVKNDSSTSDEWPSASMYSPMVIDTIAQELFGHEDDAFTPQDTLRKCFRKPLMHIVQRSWSTIRYKITSDKARMKALEAQAIASLQGELLF